MPRTLSRLALLLALCCLVGGPARAADSRRPNIVMVFIDDLGWGDFSCFGNPDAKTPHIDRLAAEGIRFSQFYVNSPICSPSRCAFTTGQYPQRWRITSFLNNRADNARRGVADWLDPQAPTRRRGCSSAPATRRGTLANGTSAASATWTTHRRSRAYGFDASLTNFEGMGPKLLPLTLKPGDAAPGRKSGPMPSVSANR